MFNAGKTWRIDCSSQKLSADLIASEVSLAAQRRSRVEQPENEAQFFAEYTSRPVEAAIGEIVSLGVPRKYP